MVTERDRALAGDAVDARLAAMIEPGSLLEATPECLVVAQVDGRILFANRHAERLTGFEREDLVGQSVELLIAADVLDLEPGSRLEAVCRTAPGPIFPCRCRWGTSTVPSG